MHPHALARGGLKIRHLTGGLGMDEFDLWERGSEVWTVDEAALILVGERPENYLRHEGKWEPPLPEHCTAFLLQLRHAIKSARLQTVSLFRAGVAQEARPDELHADEIDVHRTKISVRALCKWLGERRARPRPDARDQWKECGFADPEHPCYAPILYAALFAWTRAQSILPRGRSPKQLLKVILREHAEELRLLKPDGTIDEAAIELAARVANWQREGGAPKTI
jgi:hypothetical protein